ncbi:MAG: hypothetical protein WA715_03190 [Candidatus Acidiferrum sp.]
MKIALSIAVILLVAGCQHAPMSYNLRRQGPDPILFPPTKTKSTSSGSDTSVTIVRARGIFSAVDGCDVDGDLLSLHWQGTTAKVALRSPSFFAATPDQTDRGTYVDPLLAMEKFRADLLDRQIKGCLQSNETARLRRSIIENFPWPPSVAYFFDLGSYDVTDYFDLTPDFRLIVTSPIYSAGAVPSPATLEGYETAHYIFVADPTSDRVRLSLARATEVLHGDPAIEKHAVRSDLHFSVSPGYFRLFFMADETSVDRITRAILISAPDQEKLTQAVRKRQGTPDDFCATLSIPEITCSLFPKNFGVSPELRVRSNSEYAYIRVGGMLQELIGIDGRYHAPPPSLKVLRPFRGQLIPIKFDRTSRDILKLVLLPGDQIKWDEKGSRQTDSAP